MLEKDDRAFLATRLKDAREYRGFSQEDVARYLGVPRSAISLLESGTRRLEAIELKKLAALYQCPVAELVGESSKEVEPEAVKMVARATAALAPEDRDEVLRFALFLRSRREGKPK